MNEKLIPARVTQPSEIILNEIKARHWVIKDFQAATNLEWDLVAGVIQGAIKINHHIAERLAEGFGTSINFWVNLQIQYDKWVEKGIL